MYAGFKEIVTIIKQCIQEEKTNFVVLNFVVFQQFGLFVCFEQSYMIIYAAMNIILFFTGMLHRTKTSIVL